MSTGEETIPKVTNVDSETWELSFDVPSGCTLVSIMASQATWALDFSVGLAITSIDDGTQYATITPPPHAGDTIHRRFTAQGTYQNALSELHAVLQSPSTGGNPIDISATKNTSSMTWTADFPDRGEPLADDYSLSIEDLHKAVNYTPEPGQTISPLKLIP
jgi:hypothetical protein